MTGERPGTVRPRWEDFVPRRVVSFVYRVRRKDPPVQIHRTVIINDAVRNRAQHFCSNHVRTAKYTIWSFFPLSLFGQLRRVANFYFLIIAILSLMDSITPYTGTGKYGTLEALAIVVVVSMVRDGVEDFYRHRSDDYFNNSKTEVLRAGEFIEVRWMDVVVGDICRVKSGEYLPADIILLASSVRSGSAYIETASLDGETNLKLKSAVKLRHEYETQEDFSRLSGEFQYDVPDDRLYVFNGTCLVNGTSTPVTIQNLLPRGACLRNTAWVIGFVAYTGNDSKLIRNSKMKRAKATKLEKKLNHILLGLLSFLLLLCIFCVIMSIRAEDSSVLLDTWYLLLNVDYDWPPVNRFLTFLVSLSGLIPISLYVSLELVRGMQCLFINWDLGMYDPESDTPAAARSSTLNEELGQVQYVFSDKTGTLTQNIMVFVSCSVGGFIYGKNEFSEFSRPSRSMLSTPRGSSTATSPGHIILPGSLSAPYLNIEDSGAGAGAMSDSDTASVRSVRTSRRQTRARESLLAMSLLASDSLAERAATSYDVENPFTFSFSRKTNLSSSATFSDPKLLSSLKGTGRDSELSREFLLNLALCHTVIPQHDPNGLLEYQAASPDEEALVKAARDLGYVFTDRTMNEIELQVDGKAQRYELLHVIEFNSARKRMSVIVRNPEGVVKLYCKGADTTIFPRLKFDDNLADTTEIHLEFFASQGLRTLCIAYRVIPEDDYQHWKELYHDASVSLVDRDVKMEEVAELIEVNLDLLGATAIEDRLQDGVSDTILSLRKAGIKVWVLTGDHQETSVNIGFACGLLDPSMRLYMLTDDEPDNFKTSLTQAQDAIAADSTQGRKIALVIEGSALSTALSPDCIETFYEVSKACYSVICCRVAPLQKAQVVTMVREYEGATTLAVGDGANDVGMIRSAHVGIGISGKEGRQAVLASDYSIAQFRFLKRLLLVHGRWNYQRVSRCIMYSLYKNLVFTMVTFWYLNFCAFSGTMQIDSMLQTVFNLFFTSLPVLALATFDRDTSAELVMEHPHLYKPCISNSEFNPKLLTIYTLSGLIHSVIIIFFAMVMSEGVRWDGWVQGMHAEGLTVYTVVVCTVTFKWALLVRSWVWPSHVALIASLGTFFSYVSVFSMAFMLSYDPNTVGLAWYCFGAAQYWLAVLVVPVLALIPDIVVQSIQKMFFPTETDVLLQKALLEQRAAVKLKKRTRRGVAFMSWGRVRKVYTGFGFSAEQGQADFIASYTHQKLLDRPHEHQANPAPVPAAQPARPERPAQASATNLLAPTRVLATVVEDPDGGH